MIRTIIVVAFVILFLIISLPILGIEFLLGKINHRSSDLRQLRIVQRAFDTVARLSGVDLTVIGEENVPTDEPVLYVCNHRSFFDIVITYARCPGLTCYVSKDSMAKVPVLNIWMRRLHCLFLNREDIREGMKTILAAIDLVKKGISVCIFPEGTRNKESDEMLPFKEGSFKIARKTGCAIVPMAITNSSQILEDHFPFIRATHVTLEYGKPIYPSDLPKEQQKQLGAYCQGIIAEMLEKNQ